MKKVWYSYEDIHRIIAKLADEIRQSDFCPEAMIAIGAGGFIPARILRTFLNIPIYTVTTAYYDMDGKTYEHPKQIQWLGGVEHHLKNKRILLVDEVDDSRVTLEYCLNALAKDGLTQIGVAVIHEKIKDKKGKFPDKLPAYFSGLRMEDAWICYPWDASDIDQQNLLSTESRVIK